MLCELLTSSLVQLVCSLVIDVSHNDFSQVVNVSGPIWLPSFPVEYHPRIPSLTPSHLISILGSEPFSIAQVGQVVGIRLVIGRNSRFYSMGYEALKLVGLSLFPECYMYVAWVLVPSCLFEVDVEYLTFIAMGTQSIIDALIEAITTTQ